MTSSCSRSRDAEVDQGQARTRGAGGTEASDQGSRDSGVMVSPGTDTGLETEDTEAEDQDRDQESSDNKAGGALQVHDTPTLAHNNNNYLAPVKAELVTNELDEEEEAERLGSRKQQQHKPPPYHIAATKSKQAGNFYNIHQHQSPAIQTSQQQSGAEEHFYENQETVKRAGVNGHSRPLERKSSFLSDGTFESISEVRNQISRYAE